MCTQHRVAFVALLPPCFFPDSCFDPVELSFVEVPHSIGTRCNGDLEKGLASASRITAIQRRDSESLHTTIRTSTSAGRVWFICSAHSFHSLRAQESTTMACTNILIRNVTRLQHLLEEILLEVSNRTVNSSTDRNVLYLNLTAYTDRLRQREATLR